MTRKIWPAAQRNAEPILSVLQAHLPAKGLVLEIASGTGQHAHAFSSAMPDWTWQPTDYDVENIESINAWRSDAPPNMLAPLRLDVCAPWPIDGADAIVCCNMVHIAPIEASKGLMEGAGKVLRVGHPLVMYGPYRVGGEHISESNERFDASLRQRNPAWGVRSVEEIAAFGRDNGLELEERVAMPANNFSLVFRAL